MSRSDTRVEASGVCPMHGAVSHADCPGCRPPPDTGHTDTGALDAEACAARVLKRYEEQSPLFAAALPVGVAREMILGCMALCFNEGTIYAANKIAEQFRNKPDEQVRP